ncbi:MAG TPA: hypothetical protein PKI93_00240 [Alphaproteobacteria bacterium]|nr:hypothetical protein [Alphaproteobacteria bacterium]HNS43989.1 hypothetical protein [Alphaproteobacteria bacterium]
MNVSHPSHQSSERGSALIFVLIAVVLFAALTYAISRGGDSARNLSQEKIRLTASEIIDTGNRVSETVSRLKLRGASETEISFEYNGNYINAGCATDTCKVFAFDGGGLDWETPPASSNSGEDWGFTGDLAITNVGTASADLVMILPNISRDICHRINVLLNIEVETANPPIETGTNTANKFTGVYNGGPSTITQAATNGKKSGCLRMEELTGTAIDGGPMMGKYSFYQVLVAR